MKTKIHPKYFKNATIKCACGNEFKVGSTVENISVELCELCHPFYTGEQKLVDTAGRVEKFQAKLEKHSKAKAGAKSKTAKRAAKKAKENAKKESKKTTAKTASANTTKKNKEQ